MAFVMALLGLMLLTPVLVSAHAFGAAATLELPFPYLALSAAVALIYSFGTFLMFSRSDSERLALRTIRLGRVPAFVQTLSSCVGVGVLIWMTVEGFVRTNGSAISPAIFWIGIMLVLAYLSACIDGLWSLLNPFERLTRLLTQQMRGLYQYPAWLGSWPSLVVYIVLIILELFSGGQGALASSIALLLIVYLVLSILGAVLFGATQWFKHGDFFNMFFRMYGSIAPIRIDERGELSVASPVARLTKDAPEHISTLCFILFMTASTTFDGLSETRVWKTMFTSLPGSQSHAFAWNVVLLLVCCGVMVLAYGMVVALMRALTSSRIPTSTLALRFAYTLIPIAVAYNVAHYFVLVTLALGWDIRAEAVWTTQVAVVAAGHIYATYLAHRVAARVFPNMRDVVIGQIPMLVLMIAFTIGALRILSLAS